MTPSTPDRTGARQYTSVKDQREKGQLKTHRCARRMGNNSPWIISSILVNGTTTIYQQNIREEEDNFNHTNVKGGQLCTSACTAWRKTILSACQGWNNCRVTLLALQRSVHWWEQLLQTSRKLKKIRRLYACQWAERVERRLPLHTKKLKTRRISSVSERTLNEGKNLQTNRRSEKRGTTSTTLTKI